MQKLKCILSFVFIVVVSFLAAVASAESEETVREYETKLQWGTLLGAEAEQQRYYLEPHYKQRGELLGAFVDNTGSVYICDKITDQVIKLNPGGEEVFAVGSLGEGPEDHQKFGELLSWPGGRIARTDCVMPSKIIIYGLDGAFLSEVKLTQQETLTRLFWNGKYAVGSFTWFKYEPSVGLEIKTSLRLLNEEGVEAKVVPMGRIAHDIKRVPTLEETLIYPYVSVSEDGLCFVQQDLYGGRVDCYDQDLNKQWSFNGGWKPVLFTAEEQAESETRRISGTKHQTIRRMFARNDGEVWVQPWASEQTNEYVEFEAFGREGKRLGLVRIYGLPKETGNWALYGSKVLWMAQDQADAESVSTDSPYIRVFDLVQK